MKKLGIIIGLVAGLLVGLGTAVGQQKVEQIAAVVGSEIIMLSDVHDRMAMAAQQAQAAGEMNPSFDSIEQRALQSLVDEVLIQNEAKEMALSIESREVEAAVKNMAAQNGMSMDEFEQALAQSGMTIPVYKENVRRDLLKYKVMQMRVSMRVKITDDRVRKYYNDQVRDVRRLAEFVGAHILFRVPEDANAKQVYDIRQQVAALKEDIEAGDISFGEAAKQFSQDAVTAPRGGQLGRRLPEDIPGPLGKKFLDMESGRLQGPVRTSAGFHLLMVVEREDMGVQRFDEVKERIRGALMQKEMEKQERIWLKELRKKTYIQVNITK